MKKNNLGFTPAPIASNAKGLREQNSTRLVRGFTLIELMVVMSIIAILAGLSLLAINALRRQTNLNKAQTEEASFIPKIQVLREQKKQTLMQILNGAPECSPTSDETGCGAVWITFLGFPDAPIDPWGKIYRLNAREVPGTCLQDQIVSLGLDQVFGTSDDVATLIPFYTRACAGI